MFIQNAWYVAAWSGEIQPGQVIARKLLGQSVAIARGIDGTISVFADRCPHRGAPLSCGRVEPGGIRCMYHGLKFNAEGECVEVPGQDRIPARLRATRFPVAEKDGLVWYWPGAASLANGGQVLPVSSHGDAAWLVELGGYMHFNAACELLVDNLLDFSHLAYVHERTIGSPQLALSRPSVDRRGEELRISHWIPDAQLPANAVGLAKLPSRVDRTMEYTWRVRGNVMNQKSSITPAGSGGYASPSTAAVRKTTFIAVTPETQTSSHYFWSVAINRYETDVEDPLKIETTRLLTAFEEDRRIIEAQQKILLESQSQPLIAIAVDASVIAVRRIAHEILACEGAASAGQGDRGA